MSPRARSAAVVLVLVVAAAAIGLLLGPEAPDPDSVRSAGPANPLQRSRPGWPRGGWSTPPPPVADRPREPSAGTAPAPATGEAPGSSTLAGAPPPVADPRGDRSSLRGVRGRVVDATTRAPIADAWVTWRAVPPEQARAVLASLGSERSGGEEGLVTDRDGRFDVPRLADDAEPREALHAVATGYAPGWVVPGLADEVEVALWPAAALEVAVRGRLHEGARVAVIGPGGVGWTAPARLREDAPWHLPQLAPGRWLVTLDGAPAAGPVDLVAGGRTRVELSPPPLVRVEGILRDYTTPTLCALLLVARDVAGPPLVPTWPGEEPPLELDLMQLRDELGGAVVLDLDHDGRFRGDAPAGRYRVLLVDECERWLGEVEVRAGAAPLELSIPGEQVEVRVALDRPPPAPPRRLGVVRVDRDPLALLSLEVVPGDDPARLVARGTAEPGRYLVFLDTWLLGEVTLGALPAELSVASPVEVTLRWVLPGGLRPGEALRVRAALVPEALTSPATRRRFTRDTAWSFLVPADDPRQPLLIPPGRHRLTGRSDLGPFDVPFEVTGPGEVPIRLP